MRSLLVLCLLALPCMASAQELGTLHLEVDEGTALHLYVHDTSTATQWREMCALPCSLALDASRLWAIAPAGHDPVQAQLRLRGAPTAHVTFEDRHPLRDDGVIVLAVFLSASVASIASSIGIYAGAPQNNETFLAEIFLAGAGVLCLAIALAVGLSLTVTRDISRIVSSGVPLG